MVSIPTKNLPVQEWHLEQIGYMENSKLEQECRKVS